MRRARKHDRSAAALAAARRRRRERATRRAATAAVVVLALWLAVRAAAGAGAADFTAGAITGAVVAGVLPETLRRLIERWTRKAGLSVRTAAARPLPRVPRPLRTPIHDTAEHAQKGTE
jgi:hypothetical protein